MSGSFSILCDIDGVLHRGPKRIPGADQFVKRLQRSGRDYLFLTNSPDFSPSELRDRLKSFGFNIPSERFYTAAEAIAAFIERHSRRPRVFLVGSRALREALRGIGARFVERDPEFVIVTGGGPYDQKCIDDAIHWVCRGAKFITANGEPAGLTARGIKAGCGALIAPIETAIGCRAYVVGKPNHLMIRGAEKKYGLVPARTLMIGDSMDTDINVGMQAEMKTILVLSGITTRRDLNHSAYKPDYMFPSVKDIPLDRLP